MKIEIDNDALMWILGAVGLLLIIIGGFLTPPKLPVHVQVGILLMATGVGVLVAVISWLVRKL